MKFLKFIRNMVSIAVAGAAIVVLLVGGLFVLGACVIGGTAAAIAGDE